MGSNLLYTGFNQDNGCFAVGETTGFRVFTTHPFHEQFRRRFETPESGIGIVEMLFRCNIFALVGGGPQPRFPCNKVMIWDDHQGRCIGELTFRNQVRAVKLRRDRIAVALDHRVLIYNFADLRLVYQWETIYNGKGLLAVSSQKDNTVVACPGVHVGQVRVELMDRRDFRLINAHNTPVAAISLSHDGSRLATASEKGTLVRIFDTSSGTKLQELRRGTDPAEIYHITFDRTCSWLGVTSDKNTVHLFALRDESDPNWPGPVKGVSKPPDSHARPSAVSEGVGSPKNTSETPTNRGSWLSMAQVSVGSLVREGLMCIDRRELAVLYYLGFTKGLLPLPAYFASEWSFAQFRLAQAGRAYVGFHNDEDKLFVVTQNGSFFRLKWNSREGGPMEQEFFEALDRDDIAAM